MASDRRIDVSPISSREALACASVLADELGVVKMGGGAGEARQVRRVRLRGATGRGRHARLAGE